MLVGPPRRAVEWVFVELGARRHHGPRAPRADEDRRPLVRPEVLVEPDRPHALQLRSGHQGREERLLRGMRAAWPPLTVTGKPGLGPGIDPSIVGTITRKRRTTQVTYGGWPLYLLRVRQEGRPHERRRATSRCGG